MVIVCSWCRRCVGIKPPFDDTRFSHTLCQDCEEQVGLPKLHDAESHISRRVDRGMNETAIEIERQTTEVSYVRGQAPLPDDLLDAAKMEQARPHFVTCSDYIGAIVTLREAKGFTWREVADWFENSGVPFSMASITKVYRNANR